MKKPKHRRVILNEVKDLPLEYSSAFGLRMTLFFFFCLLFVLGGCSSRPNDTRVTLTYFTMETLPEQRRALEKMVEAFEAKHPHIRVRVDSSSSGFQKLAIRLAGGDAPDVFYYISDRLPALVHREAVMDLNRFLAQDPAVDLTQYFPETVQSGTLDGKLYFFPFHFSTDLLFYNKDLFDRAGMAYPTTNWTWDDFLKAAQKLTVEENGRTTQYGTLQPRTLFLIRSFGGNCFDPALQSVQIDSEAARRALQFLVDLEKKHRVSPSQAQLKDMEKDDGLNLFSTGKVAMFVGRTYMMTELSKLNRFSWDVAPVPRGALRYSRLAVGGNCIYRETRHPEEAWAFVKFFSGEEGSRICGSTRNGVPALKKMAVSPEFLYTPPAHVQVLVDSIRFSQIENYGLINWDEFFQKSFKAETDKVLFHASTIEDCLKTVARDAERTLREEARLREP